MAAKGLNERSELARVVGSLHASASLENGIEMTGGALLAVRSGPDLETSELHSNGSIRRAVMLQEEEVLDSFLVMTGGAVDEDEAVPLPSPFRHVDDITRLATKRRENGEAVGCLGGVARGMSRVAEGSDVRDDVGA